MKVKKEKMKKRRKGRRRLRRVTKIKKDEREERERKNKWGGRRRNERDFICPVDVTYIHYISHLLASIVGDNYAYITAQFWIHACTQFALLLSVANMSESLLLRNSLFHFYNPEVTLSVSFVCLSVRLYPDSVTNLSISGFTWMIFVKLGKNIVLLNTLSTFCEKQYPHCRL